MAQRPKRETLLTRWTRGTGNIKTGVGVLPRVAYGQEQEHNLRLGNEGKLTDDWRDGTTNVGQGTEQQQKVDNHWERTETMGFADIKRN